MFKSIRFRLTAVFIGLAVGPLIFLGAFLSWQAFIIEREQAQIVVEETAKRVGTEVQSFLSGVAAQLEMIAEVRGLQGLSKKEQQGILEELLRYKNVYEEIALLDSQGREQIRLHRVQPLSGEDLLDRSQAEEFLQPASTGQPYFGPIFFSDDTGEPHMNMAVPLKDPQTGKISGVLVGYVRLRHMWDLVAFVKVRTGESVYIIDSRNKIVAHRNPSVVLRGTEYHVSDHSVAHQNGVTTTLGISNKPVILADYHVSLAMLTLHVIAERERSAAYALAYHLVRIILLGSMVALLLGIALTVVIVGNIVRPIQRLAGVARKIEEGDLEQHADEEGGDEISELGRAFNRMTAYLRKSFESLTSEVSERKVAQRALQWELNINKSLATLSSALLNTTEISEIATLVLAKARELTGSQHGYVSTLDEHTKENVCHTLTEMMRGDQCAVTGTDRKIAFPPTDDNTYAALWGHALNSKEPFYTNDPRSFPASTGVPHGHVKVERFLSTPVLLEDELVGQIALANSARDYVAKDLEVIQRLSELYAIAISRYRSRLEREKLMTDLRQAQKMEAIGTLAGGVAHDFNNLLTPIVGYSELALATMDKDNDLHRTFEEIHRASNRAKELVQQILTFSRQREHEMVALNLQPVIKESLKLLRSSLPSTITINENISKQCGSVFSDLTQIHQVVMNLCTNSYHAMEEKGGTLTVSLDEVAITPDGEIGASDWRPGQYVCLAVEDTGQGMDQDVVDRVFEPYFTTKAQGKGTGMGLALVHGIIKSHKGYVTVESLPGQGTTFKVYLPVTKIEDAVFVEDDVVAPERAQGSETILLVDDEEQIVVMMQEMLEYLGYRVIAATDSHVAWEIFQERFKDIDVVVTDQTMPGLTGDTLARMILGLRPDVPILICTGYSETMNEKRAKAIGIKGYLMKPVVVKEMAQSIRQVLDEV